MWGPGRVITSILGGVEAAELGHGGMAPWWVPPDNGPRAPRSVALLSWIVHKPRWSRPVGEGVIELSTGGTELLLQSEPALVSVGELTRRRRYCYLPVIELAARVSPVE